jgi:hypothetical protein
MHSKYSLMASIALTFGVFSPASAAMIDPTLLDTFTTQAAWAAVSLGLTTIPFSSTFYGTSLALSGATFTTSASDPFFVMDTTGSSYWGYGTGLAIEVPSNNLQPILQVALPAGTTSFGLNLTTVSPYNDSLTVTVNGVSYNITSFSPTGGGFAFFGATFDAPITSFAVASTTGDYLFADNVSFGTNDDPGPGGTGGPPSATPEAATLLMIGSGLIGMRMMNKRMHLFGA